MDGQGSLAAVLALSVASNAASGAALATGTAGYKLYRKENGKKALEGGLKDGGIMILSSTVSDMTFAEPLMKQIMSNNGSYSVAKASTDGIGYGLARALGGKVSLKNFFMNVAVGASASYAGTQALRAYISGSLSGMGGPPVNNVIGGSPGTNLVPGAPPGMSN